MTSRTVGPPIRPSAPCKGGRRPATGRYADHHVRCDHLGSPDRDTLIRAAIPGTALLRGDVPAPEFKKVDGYRFVYAAAVDQDVQTVNELDTLTILGKMPNVGNLEFVPGTFYRDPADRKLYISSSDMQAPVRHHYTVSVNPRSGLYLEKPVRVVVPGRSTGPGHPLNHQSLFPVQMLAFPLMSYTIFLFHALFLSSYGYLVKDH